jgi:hypothetical protein
MKTRTVVACVVLALLGATGAGGAAAPSPATQAQEQPATEPLATRIPSIDADGTAALKVLTYLCDNAHVNLVMEANGLANLPVTLRMKDVSVETALDAVLAQEGCGYEIQDQNLYVFDLGSPPAARVHLEVYGVGDLVDYTSTAEMTTLMETIKASVAPDSWLEAGGKVGSIRSVKGSLVINQLARNHRAVGALLAKLRAHKDDPSTAAPAEARQMQAQVQIVGNLKETCADPEAMGIVAVSELRSAGSKKPAETIAFLQGRLEKTKSLPLRNAIRLALKDLYLEVGDAANVQKQLEAILAENDRGK